MSKTAYVSLEQVSCDPYRLPILLLPSPFSFECVDANQCVEYMYICENTLTVLC